jgi:hypothetical protein
MYLSEGDVIDDQSSSHPAFGRRGIDCEQPAEGRLILRLHSRVDWCIGFQRVMNERGTDNVFLFHILISEWMYISGPKVNLHHTAK